MERITTRAAMQAHAMQARCAGRTLALVPTMGALHEGHLSLVKLARAQADHVTVSIFVNPTQFGPNEDFDQYPRTLEPDLEALRNTGGVDAVFMPQPNEMYPEVPSTWVRVDHLDAYLCGQKRPGHFLGVTTIVTKLFIACRPDRAVFGLKDAQQFLILRRMTRELGFGIQLVGAPIVREPDGLALSSRNRYLSPAHREQAVVLSRAVREARARMDAGEQRTGVLIEAMRHHLAQAPDARVQYVEVVDTEQLRPLGRLQEGQNALAAMAVFFGETRLIDNTFRWHPAA